jgi:hypothetical protein
MAAITHRVATVKPWGGPRFGGLGARNDSNLQAIFSSSPLFNEYNEETVLNAGTAAFNGAGGPGDSIPNIGVTAGVVVDDGTFGSVNLNFVDSPNPADVLTGGGGLPASSYVPNLNSAKVGSISPADQDPYIGALPVANNEYGRGPGTGLTPDASARAISSQKIGSLIKGTSS